MKCSDRNTVEKKKHWKTSRREISSPESETVRKGSKSGAPDEIGRYHMYAKCMSVSNFMAVALTVPKKHG